MNRVFDCIPFFDELDILEIRLHELDKVVDAFIISEAGETYGGTPKPYVFEANRARFADFRHKIIYQRVPKLFPECKDRVTGRQREAFARDAILACLHDAKAEPNDVVMLSDCDEIPRADSVAEGIARSYGGQVHRFKQRSFYYNVNRLVDYGHDWASRARIGRFRDVLLHGSMYAFRMAEKNTDKFVIENGGWHFGYFGDLEKIKTKVAALSPFLSEYRLFGHDQLVEDIKAGKDLHHRRCELPEVFTQTLSDDPTLPAYLLANRAKFAHFTIEGQLKEKE